MVVIATDWILMTIALVECGLTTEILGEQPFGLIGPVDRKTIELVTPSVWNDPRHRIHRPSPMPGG